EPGGGRDDPGRVEHASQHGQARIGNADYADVRLDGRERVVRGQRACPGQRVEQSGLPEVGQPDEADGETHLGESRADHRVSSPGRWPGELSEAAATMTGHE